MRYVLKFALLFLCLLTAIASPAARAETDDDSSAKVLVSPEQGEALAAFALQSERRIRYPKPDCSHLVHQLYARAGLIYPYEDSRVLYRGVSDFQRVKMPQSGDLAVWLGHVGIVLSPEEKTFLSSVRSGIITESWTAPHWVRRGHPRFYRYRIGPDTDMDLLARIMNDENLSQLATRRNARSGTNSELPYSANTDSDVASSQQERTDSSVQDTKNTDETDNRSPSIVAVVAQRQMPSRRQIEAAIMAMCQEDGRIQPARTMERELSIVRSSEGVWVISDPQERTYLIEEQALGIFEHQAELFLRRAPNSSNTRVVVKALDRLYDQQIGTAQRAAIR
jgi:hypothetical protein